MVAYVPFFFSSASPLCRIRDKNRADPSSPLLGPPFGPCQYFNQWAFVFVGLYGYPFVESGRNVLNLFRTRGWTTIITDNLAQGALRMVAVAVGLMTGLVALGVSTARGMVFGDELGASAASFFVGFVVGCGLTATLMTLVSSAVNTVIVCYAEAPAEFQRNHPKLSEDMREAWRAAWPSEFHY